ncbi:MAG TPA: reductive dehalogenase [Burkholderiales bacterium]|nr:reductive dehalogenase [Burkholderiales bacterium]
MRIFSNSRRPVHLGRFPLERLPRAPLSEEALQAVKDLRATSLPENALARICREYCAIYERFRGGAPAPEKAPYFEAPQDRANELKSMALFFDATLVATSAIPAAAWLGAPLAGHTHAVVLLAEYADLVERGNPVYDLIKESDGAAAKLRATEVGVVLSAYIRQLGFSATAHTPAVSDVSLRVLALAAGLIRKNMEAPFIGRRFALAAVTTDMQLAVDLPLAEKSAFDGGAAWWLGTGGTETWWNRWAQRRRPGEWGRYPMEKVKRVAESTTLIVDDEVPRMPKRSNGFYRGKKGDFGEKVAREFGRFAIKTPAGAALADLQIAQTPFQDGEVAPQVDPASLDPQRNRRALKTLLHHLGADIAGTCEARRYAWYSHDYAGKPIDIYHASALVMVIDQGFETMEGASGDDWVSGTQSFRAYVRGGQIAGVVAAYIRSLGHSARSHTNADSDVIQTPLVVLAGLGEMSRIGETVLNPFLGPRSKSAVVTTNLPLAWDRPIDFGLQDSCRKCMKCARECPCDAITYGEPVMFNGYEQWKQDVQRCTSYRMTNQGGAACGRCMKACPYNNEGLLVHRLATWVATHFAFSKPYLAKLDDRLGYGDINPVKRWWADLEIVAGRVTKPAHVNRRGLDRAKGDKLKATQKIAYINADMLPPPDWRAPFPVDRKASLAAAQKLETPAQARARIKSGGPKPAHYIPKEPAP